MNPLLATTMLVFGAVAGVIGWRRTTKYVYRRSVYQPDIPEGISRPDHERAGVANAGASSSHSCMRS